MLISNVATPVTPVRGPQVTVLSLVLKEKEKESR